MEEADAPKIVQAEPGEVVLRALPESQDDGAAADVILPYAPPKKRQRGYLLDAVTWPRVFMTLYILVVLAVVTAWIMPMYNPGYPSPRLRQALATRSRLTEIASAVESFRRDVGRFPTAAEGLAALAQRPAGAVRWRGPYIKYVTIDVWLRPYRYVSPGIHHPSGFDLSSDGPDGISGTADDITNW